MKQRFILSALLCVISVLVSQMAMAKSPATERHVVGYVERVVIPRLKASYKAKMDTGAATSSIHAEVIEIHEATKDSDEKGYVVFTVDTGKKGEHQLKKPITRMVNIKKKEGGTQQRPVIEMTFCIAGVLVHEEVNLTNRDDFNYDVLVGRNMLIKGGFIIDASKDFVSKPNCPDDTKPAKKKAKSKKAHR